MDRPHTPSGLVATLDQLGALLADIAGMLGDYRKQLLAHGFTEDDAIDLCVDVQRALLQRHGAEDEDDEG